ncbi:unnamed protein product [Diplocarpon coronariae]
MITSTLWENRTGASLYSRTEEGSGSSSLWLEVFDRGGPGGRADLRAARVDPWGLGLGSWKISPGPRPRALEAEERGGGENPAPVWLSALLSAPNVGPPSQGAELRERNWHSAPRRSGRQNLPSSLFPASGLPRGSDDGGPNSETAVAREARGLEHFLSCGVGGCAGLVAACPGDVLLLATGLLLSARAEEVWNDTDDTVLLGRETTALLLRTGDEAGCEGDGLTDRPRPVTHPSESHLQAAAAHTQPPTITPPFNSRQRDMGTWKPACQWQDEVSVFYPLVSRLGVLPVSRRGEKQNKSSATLPGRLVQSQPRLPDCTPTLPSMEMI